MFVTSYAFIAHFRYDYLPGVTVLRLSQSVARFCLTGIAKHPIRVIKVQYTTKYTGVLSLVFPGKYRFLILVLEGWPFGTPGHLVIRLTGIREIRISV